MKLDIFDIILKDTLTYYLGLDDTSPEKHLKEVNATTKERIGTINDLQVIVYSNDHNPPHFHVKSKDLKINAKFSILNCEHLSGEISSKNLKKIKAFYLSQKGKAILNTIWSKRNI